MKRKSFVSGLLVVMAMTVMVNTASAISIDLTNAQFLVTGQETVHISNVTAVGFPGTYGADLVLDPVSMVLAPTNVARETVVVLNGRIQNSAGSIFVYDNNGAPVSKTQTAADGSFSVELQPMTFRAFVVLSEGLPNETILALTNTNGAGLFTLNPGYFDLGNIALNTDTGIAMVGKDITLNPAASVQLEAPTDIFGTWYISTTIDSSNCPGVSTGPGNAVTAILSGIGGSKVQVFNPNSPHGETLFGAENGKLTLVDEYVPSNAVGNGAPAGVLREAMMLNQDGSMTGTGEFVANSCSVAVRISGHK